MVFGSGSSGVVAWALRMSLRLLFFYQRHAFIRAGFQEHQVQSQIRILGVDLLAATCVDQGNAGSARIDESLKFAQRLARVPLPLNVRTNLCRTRIIPKVSWGWLFRDLGFRI